MILRFLLAGFWLAWLAPSMAAPAKVRFEISRPNQTGPAPLSGRVYVVLSRDESREPRLLLGGTGLNFPQSWAMDVTNWSGGRIVLREASFAFPDTNILKLAAGEYRAQAVFDFNYDFRSPNAPGNLYSVPQAVRLEPGRRLALHFQLTRRLPPDQLPPENDFIKFIKIKSDRLSRFQGRDIYLRAGVVLPRDYDNDAGKRFPVWIRIAGLNGRYTGVQRLMGSKSDFRRMWLEPGTPQFILVQLDGVGPLGDPYYVNSANSGPYADALMQELIPALEKRFRASQVPGARVLSGVSTGGWVALALQIFHPDAFAGAWAACPDPVDFRALEAINIYQDENAYVNEYGNERPSERNLDGDVVLTVRRETGAERLLGRGGHSVTSGQQWGEWTAAFSPRGADGLPLPLWDEVTGKINPAVAREWRKFDLRLVLQENLQTLAPRLKGKLHISAAECDRYFLNNAVHLLDDALRQAKPSLDLDITYGERKDHGWSNLTSREMLDQMQAAVDRESARRSR